MTLTQGAPTTGRAISVIDWSSFNIGSSAQVTFIQPSVSSVVLNRVTGSTATRIDGGLLAQGQIWLLNGNGVMVGSSGNINAAGFLAGTVGISDSSFAAGFSSTTPGSNSSTGNFSFTPTCSTNCTTLGQILNQGVINATNNGYVLLGAEQVRNEGSIQADLGFIGLGAGKAFTLSFSGDRTLQFATVDQDVQLVASNTTSNLFTSLATNGSNALISNSGNLVSRGGKVALYAATALNVAQQVVNTSGLINADTVSVDSHGNVFFTINDTFSATRSPPVSYGSYPTNILYNGSIDIVGKTSANVITGDIVNSGIIRANNNFTNTATSVTPGQDQSIRLVGGTVTNTSSGMISANSLWIDPAFESSRTVSIPTTAVVSKVDIFAVNDVINSGGILANTPVGTGLISVVSNAGSVTNTSSGAIQADGFDGGFVNVITSTNGSQTNSGVISAAPLTQLNGNSATTVFANTPTLRSIFSSASAGLAGTITNQSLAVGASGLTPSTGTVPATTTSSSTATGANSTTTALKALVPISPALATLATTPLGTTTFATTPLATAAPQATAPQSSSTQSQSTSTTDPSIASSKEQPTNAVAPVDAQPPATVELAQQTAVGQNPQVAVASTQQPTSVPSQQQDTKQNPSTQPPSNTSQGTPAAPVPGPSGATTLNSGPTSTVSTSSSASMPTPVPIPSSNASGLPPSAPNNAGVTLAMAKATGQPVAFVSPASVATTQLAPTPPSPVGDVKSPTPKDAADSGDKTLAAATPPSVTSASASKRSASKANTSQVGMVGVQVNGAAKTPVANAQEQRFSQIGNSASW